jgi:Asp-tRNA(Asn)/Glu-tRNA(Gln) amidotransferase A subunit family amidase
MAALKQLGAVLVGKGAMNELGIFGHGHNSHAGTTLNPHCHIKSAGGSSSGAAAAVAVGLCPIAIGADGGGSIRIPSSLCGVAGLKTTTGRLADDHGGGGGGGGWRLLPLPSLPTPACLPL